MILEESVRTAAGLYTLKEAADYARMHHRTLAGWMYGGTSISQLRPPQIPLTEGKYLTFVEFVEALAIRNLRVNYDVPFQKIRQAVNEAKEKYGVEYPFSNKTHKTFLIKPDLHIRLGGGDLVQLSGKDRGQTSMKVCLEQFMHDLEWDATETANGYIAYRYPVQDQDPVIIKMRPGIYFGAPVVEGTGHTADTLWKAALAEGSMEKVAEYYEVNANSVIAACRYCEEIKQAA
jgi:uncharacterized protein (DUF433 family)